MRRHTETAARWHQNKPGPTARGVRSRVPQTGVSPQLPLPPGEAHPISHKVFKGVVLAQVAHFKLGVKRSRTPRGFAIIERQEYLRTVVNAHGERSGATATMRRASHQVQPVCRRLINVSFNMRAIARQRKPLRKHSQ
eukprot:scaffold476_cov111-Isochrysis_galbana.AAC.7